MFFRRPKNPEAGFSKEQKEEKLEKFRSMGFTKDDEKDLIRAALRTLLPWVLLLVALFSIPGLLLLWWLQ